jgi:hypothetical protein
MRKTTTTTHPDGGVTTTKSKSSCGCMTFLVVLFGAGLMIQAWQSSSTLERTLYIAVPVLIGLVALGIYGARENKREASAASDEAN